MVGVPKSKQEHTIDNSYIKTNELKEKEKENEDWCKGHDDPFERQTVEQFHPPDAAPFEKVQKWNSMVKTTLKNVSKLKIGGSALR